MGGQPGEQMSIVAVLLAIIAIALIDLALSQDPTPPDDSNSL